MRHAAPDRVRPPHWKTPIIVFCTVVLAVLAPAIFLYGFLWIVDFLGQ